MLHINELIYRVEGRPLFERATVAINAGEKTALVGRNGSGKSTLLRLILGQLQPDGGEISLTKGLSVGTVAQEAPSGPESLLDTVLAADKARSALLAEAARAEAPGAKVDPHRIAEVHERLVAIGAESAPARAARILAGLGFDEAAQAQSCRALSGGWRMRVALAALLFSAPDLMLLDEPTNHLDLEAALWLESYLKAYRGTLILVSHDRGLLNSVPERIVHLAAQRLTAYRGNYDRFERTRREQLAREAALQSRQQAQRRHIQAFVDRFRYKASKARQAQSRLKALARMEPIASMMEERTPPIRFPQPEELAPPLITMESAAVGYSADKPVLSRLALRLDQDDRVALLGANGNGKSTFIKLLADRLKAQAGHVTRSNKLKVGYFSQDQAEELDLSATPLDHLARLMPLATPERLRALLGGFGFGREKVEVAVGRLSGGEKARLLLALMAREAPQILLLDEPTNHLDVDARESLIQALNEYQGAVVLVSHDPHLIELIADRLWMVADGTVQSYDGDLEDYRKLLLEQRRAERRQSRAAKAEAKAEQAEGIDGTAEILSKKDKRRAAAEARAAVADLRRAARDAETKLEKLAAKKSQLEARLADPEIYNGPTAKLMALQLEHGNIKQAIAKAEEAWLEAQGALEDV